MHERRSSRNRPLCAVVRCSISFFPVYSLPAFSWELDGTQLGSIRVAYGNMDLQWALDGHTGRVIGGL